MHAFLARTEQVLVLRDCRVFPQADARWFKYIHGSRHDGTGVRTLFGVDLNRVKSPFKCAILFVGAVISWPQ